MWEYSSAPGRWQWAGLSLLVFWSVPLSDFYQKAQENIILPEQTLVEMPQKKNLTLLIPSHRSIARLLKEIGFTKEIIQGITALTKKMPLRVGQKLLLSYEESENAKILTSLRIPLNIKSEIEITKQADSSRYICQKKKLSIRTEFVRIQGQLSHNIFSDLAKQGVSYPMAVALVKSMAAAGLNWRFHSRSGMKFSLLYKQLKNPQTSETALEELLLVKFSNKTSQYGAYKYQPRGSSCCQFYNELGLSCHEEKFGRPLAGGRITSRFGMRRHPITCSYKMHTGVDFAAPLGTPVLAAGSGIIEKVCWKGGYGKYVRIVHAKGYRTIYGHLKQYAKGLRVGQRVHKGQLIGYIGCTGRATGPHLHFEVLDGNRPVNPLKTVSYTSELTNKQKTEFRSYVRHLWQLYNRLSSRSS